MSAQLKEQWETMDLKGLSQAIADKNEEQKTFYNANKGRWDGDRVTIFENRNKELEKMVLRQKSLQKVEASTDDSLRAREISSALKTPYFLRPTPKAMNGSPAWKPVK
jgi:hypothetical protein